MARPSRACSLLLIGLSIVSHAAALQFNRVDCLTSASAPWACHTCSANDQFPILENSAVSGYCHACVASIAKGSDATRCHACLRPHTVQTDAHMPRHEEVVAQCMSCVPKAERFGLGWACHQYCNHHKLISTAAQAAECGECILAIGELGAPADPWNCHVCMSADPEGGLVRSQCYECVKLGKNGYKCAECALLKTQAEREHCFANVVGDIAGKAVPMVAQMTHTRSARSTEHLVAEVQAAADAAGMPHMHEHFLQARKLTANSENMAREQELITASAPGTSSNEIMSAMRRELQDMVPIDSHPSQCNNTYTGFTPALTVGQCLDCYRAAPLNNKWACSGYCRNNAVLKNTKPGLCVSCVISATVDDVSYCATCMETAAITGDSASFPKCQKCIQTPGISGQGRWACNECLRDELLSPTKRDECLACIMDNAADTAAPTKCLAKARGLATGGDDSLIGGLLYQCEQSSKLYLTPEDCSTCVTTAPTSPIPKAYGCISYCQDDTLNIDKEGNIIDNTYKQCTNCITSANVQDPWACSYCMQATTISADRQDCFDCLEKAANPQPNYNWGCGECSKIEGSSARQACYECISDPAQDVCLCVNRYRNGTVLVDGKLIGRDPASNCFDKSQDPEPTMDTDTCLQCEAVTGDRGYACSATCRNNQFIDPTAENANALVAQCYDCLSNANIRDGYACTRCLNVTKDASERQECIDCAAYVGDDGVSLGSDTSRAWGCARCAEITDVKLRAKCYRCMKDGKTAMSTCLDKTAFTNSTCYALPPNAVMSQEKCTACEEGEPVNTYGDIVPFHSIYACASLCANPALIQESMSMTAVDQCVDCLATANPYICERCLNVTASLPLTAQEPVRARCIQIAKMSEGRVAGAIECATITDGILRDQCFNCIEASENNNIYNCREGGLPTGDPDYIGGLRNVCRSITDEAMFGPPADCLTCLTNAPTAPIPKTHVCTDACLDPSLIDSAGSAALCHDCATSQFPVDGWICRGCLEVTKGNTVKRDKCFDLAKNDPNQGNSPNYYWGIRECMTLSDEAYKYCIECISVPNADVCLCVYDAKYPKYPPTDPYCPNPLPDLPYGYYDPEGFLIGAEAEPVCSEGYQLFSGSRLVCDYDAGSVTGAAWRPLQPDQPECRPVTEECLPQPANTNCLMIGPTDGNRRGSVVRYRCVTGFEVFGMPGVTQVAAKCVAATNTGSGYGSRWNVTAPICVPPGGDPGAPCLTPPEGSSGGTLSLVLSEYPSGTTVSLVCPWDAPFATPERATCINGQWTNGFACKPNKPVVVTCTDLPSFDDGRITYSGAAGSAPNARLPGVKATATCLTISNTLDGPAEKICSQVGDEAVWFPVDSYMCVKPCLKETPVANALEFTNKLYRQRGSTITYQCNAGYTLQGVTTRTCISNTATTTDPTDSIYEGEQPTCVPSGCLGSPTRPSDMVTLNVTLDASTLSPDGTVVAVVCTGDLQPPKITTSTCSKGVWTNFPLYPCTTPNPTDCTTLPPVAGGTITYTTTPSPTSTVPISTVASLTCDIGYTLVGPASRKCIAVTGENPQFDGTSFFCAAPCDVLAQPANGIVVYNGERKRGTTAEYKCDPGFILDTLNVDALPIRTCQDSSFIPSGGSKTESYWTGIALDCTRPYCVVPPPGADLTKELRPQGILIPSRATYVWRSGTTVTITCSADLELSATCQDGIWSNSISCGDAACTEMVAGPQVSISYSTVKSTGSGKYSLGTVATGTCTFPYTLESGSNLRTCSRVGNTNSYNFGAPFVCVPPCPVAPNVTNAIITYQPADKPRGSTATYTCAPGYEISGTDTITCVVGPTASTSAWSYTTLPTCKGVPCASAPTFSADTSSISPVLVTYPSGTVVTLKCSTTFPVAPAILTSTCVQGSWTVPDFQACDKPAPPTCADLPAVANGAITYSAAPANARPLATEAVLKCNAGFSVRPYVDLLASDRKTCVEVTGSTPAAAVFSPSDNFQCLANCPALGGSNLIWTYTDITQTKLPSATNYPINTVANPACPDNFDLTDGSLGAGYLCSVVEISGVTSLAWVPDVAVNAASCKLKVIPPPPVCPLIDQMVDGGRYTYTFSGTAVPEANTTFALDTLAKPECNDATYFFQGDATPVRCQRGTPNTTALFTPVKPFTCTKIKGCEVVNDNRLGVIYSYSRPGPPFPRSSGAAPSTATPGCSTGYYASISTPPTPLVCSAGTPGDTSVWTGSNPDFTCFKYCAPLVKPSNGIITMGSGVDNLRITRGSIATFSCDAGYTPSVTSSTCQAKTGGDPSDSDWTAATFTCVPDACSSVPALPVGAVFVNSNYTAGAKLPSGSSVQMSCNANFGSGITGNFVLSCLNGKLSGNVDKANGVWGVCNKPCEKPMNPGNGTVNGYSVDTSIYPGRGSYVQYVCNPGFVLSSVNASEGVRRCEALAPGSADSAFSGSAPTCVVDPCYAPPDPPTGCCSGLKLSQAGNQVTATITCNSRFKGVTTLQCASGGSYSTRTWGTCDPEDCAPPPTPAGTNAPKLTVLPAWPRGSKAVYTCPPGTDLASGDLIRTCITDTTSSDKLGSIFDGVEPRCKEKPCTCFNDDITDGDLVSRDQNGKKLSSCPSGSVTSIDCRKGYKVANGVSSATCSKGAWVPAVGSSSSVTWGTCVPNAGCFCALPGSDDLDAYQVTPACELEQGYVPCGSKVRVRCKSSSKMMRPYKDYLVCKGMNQWSGTWPVCRAPTCADDQIGIWKYNFKTKTHDCGGPKDDEPDDDDDEEENSKECPGGRMGGCCAETGECKFHSCAANNMTTSDSSVCVHSDSDDTVIKSPESNCELADDFIPQGTTSTGLSGYGSYGMYCEYHNKKCLGKGKYCLGAINWKADHPKYRRSSSSKVSDKWKRLQGYKGTICISDGSDDKGKRFKFCGCPNNNPQPPPVPPTPTCPSLVVNYGTVTYSSKKTSCYTDTRSLNIGIVAKTVCKSGYELIPGEGSSSTVLTCVSNGSGDAKWDNAKPVCRPKDCTDMALPPGHIIEKPSCRGNSYGARIKVRCDEESHKSGYLVCARNNDVLTWKWQSLSNCGGGTPACSVTCPPIDAGINYKFRCIHAADCPKYSLSKRIPGCKHGYTCYSKCTKSGFCTGGTKYTATCGADGKWIGLNDCPPPQII